MRPATPTHTETARCAVRRSIRRSQRGLAENAGDGTGDGSPAGAAVGSDPAAGETRMPSGEGVEASAVAEAAAADVAGAGDTGAATAVDGVAGPTASANTMPSAPNWNLI